MGEPDIAAIRERHVGGDWTEEGWTAVDHDGECKADGQEWPCDADQLLALLAATADVGRTHVSTPSVEPPLSERESADGAHMPRPSDICSVCGNGLVHIDSWRDRPSVEPAGPYTERAEHERQANAGAHSFDEQCPFCFFDHFTPEARTECASWPPAEPAGPLVVALRDMIDTVAFLSSVAASGERLDEHDVARVRGAIDRARLLPTQASDSPEKP